MAKLFSWLLYSAILFSFGVISAFVYIERVWLPEASTYVNITDFVEAQVVIERDIDGYSSEWETIKLDAIPTIQTTPKRSSYGTYSCSGGNYARK